MTCGPPLIRPDWLWWATLKVFCLFPNSDQTNLEGKTHVSWWCKIGFTYTQVCELEMVWCNSAKGMANMHNISQVLQWVLFQLDVCFSLTLSWHPFKRPLGFTGMANIMALVGKKNNIDIDTTEFQAAICSLLSASNTSFLDEPP